MQTRHKKDDKGSKKVLFIRLDEDIYAAVAALADEEERSINTVATRLLKSALEHYRSSN